MPYLYVVAAILLRLMPHPWNMSPVGAMFLFSGATFHRKKTSLAIPLVALILSDAAVNHFIYGGRYDWFTPYKWGAFLLVGVIGWALRGRITWGRVVGASLAGSVIFFVISNIGVWAMWQLYPLTLEGLGACFVAALPFFRNTLLGDLAYAAVMFGSYQFLRHRQLTLTPDAR